MRIKLLATMDEATYGAILGAMLPLGINIRVHLAIDNVRADQSDEGNEQFVIAAIALPPPPP